MSNRLRVEGCPRGERLPEFAIEVFQGAAPDAELDRHVRDCDECLRELGEIQRDLLQAERVTAAAPSVSNKLPTFRMEKGLLRSILGFAFQRPGPAFRSGGHSVIHSSIIPLTNDYVLLEVSGAESGMKLHLEKGAKNGDRIRISLYINDQLSDKRKLHESLSWDIQAFSPGRYRLQLEEKTVLTFDIKE